MAVHMLPRRGETASTKLCTKTVWMHIFLVCLGIVYIGISVKISTKQYLVSPLPASSKEGPNTFDAKPFESPKSRHSGDKETMKKETEAERRARNPFLQKHDDLTFGEGVKPDILLAIPDEAPLAAKEDLPEESHPTPNYILKAYIEPIEFKEWDIKPLPNRSTARANNLVEEKYTRLNSCSKLMQQWPVDDTPTEKDPFLPWIHDVFPTADGKYIQFVAQNRQRCDTGRNDEKILAFRNPVASNFQHISVKRIQEQRGDDGSTKKSRYRLCTHEDADPDGLATRFICRFKPSMEETLSTFNFDYDWITRRKRYRASFHKNKGNVKSIHTSQLIFRCPVPIELQEIVRTGSSVQNDWATQFLDLIPIRTPPRYGAPNRWLLPQYQEFQAQGDDKFDPVAEYGEHHVVPLIEDSGRWENIPICKPSLMTYENQKSTDLPTKAEEIQNKHNLVSCLWASAGYTTRGERAAINDGQRRLLEWITYNKMIGFDHVYLYDNSGATSNTASLKPIADLFPDHVTYIPWPSKVCNNRQNNVDSPGERSSQYAAEQSCRLRFGPHVNWIGQFDIDEYLIPMGNHTTVLSLLDKLDAEDTRIINFPSWRAWPRRTHINEPVPITDQDVCWHNEPCFELSIPTNYTMLQAYNCDRNPPGQKTKTMPAEKQLYRANYVTSHFVHYSTVTTLMEKNKTEFEKEGFKWKLAFPDPRQRFVDEVTEGLMIHSKSVATQDTAGWQRMCHLDNLKLPPRRRGTCRLGVPWPNHPDFSRNGTKEGWQYNCYVNDKVENYFVPRLEDALKQGTKELNN